MLREAAVLAYFADRRGFLQVNDNLPTERPTFVTRLGCSDTGQH
jgi:hypothetical protein